MCKNLIALLLCMPFSLAWSFHAQQAKQQCTSTPCANTPTGEDRGEIELREAKAELDKIRASSDDKLRWEEITIFSNSKDPKNQTLLIHKASNTQITLDGAKGSLTFRTPQHATSFQIASPPGGSDNPCPKYQIEVVDATSEHAVIRKICPKYAYDQGHEFKSFDYYLYDRASATMRAIWSASAIQNVSMLKAPSPDPMVSPTANGYRYQWKGQVALGGSMGTVSYNNVYERKKSKDGLLELVCKDMSEGKQGTTEGGSCEGETLTRTNRR